MCVCTNPSHKPWQDRAALELPPPEFITEQFFADGVVRVLEPGGVAAINVIAYDALILREVAHRLNTVCC